MSNPEAIIQLLSGEIKHADLSSTQKDYYKRVTATYDLILDGNPSTYIQKVIMEKFGYSRSQSWRILRETELIFSNMEKVNKSVHRRIAAEMAKKAYRKAELRGDAKAMVAAVNAYTKAYGLDQEDPDTPEFEKLAPSTIIILPPTNTPKLGKIAGGMIDLNDFQMPKTIEIAHEEPDTKARD